MENFSFPEYRFVLRLDGRTVGWFREVAGWENIMCIGHRCFVGVSGDLTCKQGRLDAELFADWGLNESWVVHRKMITIELTDETGCAVMTWEVTNAWMKKATLSQSPAERGRRYLGWWASIIVCCGGTDPSGAGGVQKIGHSSHYAAQPREVGKIGNSQER